VKSKFRETLNVARRDWQPIFDSFGDAACILDPSGRILRCNSAMGKILRMRVQDIKGRLCYELMHDAHTPPYNCPMEKTRHSLRRETAEAQIGERWYKVTVDPIRNEDGNFGGAIHIISDITEQKVNEESFRQTQRAFRILSRCNAAVVRAREEHTLLAEVCNIAVGPAGYYIAWVGYAEMDEARTVRPVSYAGPAREFLDEIRVSWAEDDYGHGAVGSAIRLGKPVVVHNIMENPNFAVWRSRLSKVNMGAVLALPLKADDISFGALAIYAQETDAFQDAEVALLEELGNNLSHGIMALRTRQERSLALEALERAHGELEERVVERTAQLLQEIQDRKLAEDSLRQSELKYRELIENANSIILKMDPQCRVTFFNEFAQNFFGYSESEILGQSVVGTIVPEVDRFGRDLKEILRDIAEHPESYAKNENENLLRTGQRVWIAWTNRPIRDESGRLVGTLCIGNDITELKRTEGQLRVFQQFAENAGQGFGIAEIDGRFTYMNPGLLDMLSETGWTPDQKRMLHQYLPDESSQSIFSDIKVSLSQRANWTGEIPLIARSGKKIPVLVNFFLIHDESGQPKYLAGLFTDMTRHKEAELQILRAKEMAESADRIKSAFLASMSHELRTPLNSIIGFTGILLQGLAGPLNDEQKKQMGMVQNSARHLLQLINDVLDISKIEAGQLQLYLEDFNLAQSIRQVVEIITPLADKKGLELVVDVSPEVGMIYSDRRRVEQILINLLSNAVKFTDHGKISLESTVSEDHIAISITDTGIGLKSENMKSLFLPFRQVDIGVARRYEGTGLGLSICKRLLEMLGGQIWVESEGEGAGSTFGFSLPLISRRPGQ